MTIITEVNGIEYVGFVGISAIDSIYNLCNQYRQECSSEDGGNSFPIKRGSSVKIKVDGIKVFDGHCEISQSESDKNSKSVKTEGRDTQKDILKTDLDPSVNIKGPVSLVSVIKKSLKASGIHRNVVDMTGGIKDLTRKEQLNDDVGTNIFDYWIELARKRQTLITSNSDGDIVLFRPGTLKYSQKLINRKNDDGKQNNIIQSSLKCDDSKRCHKYVVHSQYNFSVRKNKKAPTDGTLAGNHFDTGETGKKEESEDSKALLARLEKLETVTEEYNATLDEIFKEGSGENKKQRRSTVNTQGVAYDISIPPGSTRHIVAEKPSDDDECERLAKWHANLERAKSVEYSCTVPELTIEGSPWKAGYLIDVIDDDEDIDSTMLITNVEFSVSKSESGSYEENAKLSLTVPDAFSEDATVDNSLVRINKIGGNWNEGTFL